MASAALVGDFPYVFLDGLWLKRSWGGEVKKVAAMLKAIPYQEDAEAAQQKARLVVEKLRAMKLAKAAEIVENGIGETLSHYSLPPEHWRWRRTNNPLERLMREILR